MTLSTPLVRRLFGLPLLFLLAGPVLAQDNLISFGDFEALDTGEVTTIDGSFVQIPENSSLTVVDDMAHTGDQSLRADYGGGAANFYDFQLIGQPAVTPGQEYTASVWARSETDGGTFSFGAQNPSDFSNLGDAFYGAALTTEWQEFTTTFTVPDGVTSLNIATAFGYDATNVGNAVYIDDLSLTAAGDGGGNGGDPLAPVVVEAESGTLGSEAATGTDGDVTYAEITTDFSAGTGDAAVPQTDARVISYDVTFPAPGVYALYARVYVGTGGATDDSFLLGNGFGDKDPALASDWVIANQLDVAGFTADDSDVAGDGTAGGGVWKWVALTGAARFNIADSLYTVGDSDPLTQTFEIGGREDGLRFDKFAFAPIDRVYTVADLDAESTGRGVAREDDVESVFSLQAAPNPVAGSARISFETPAAGRVSLQVFDAMGRLVQTLVDAERPAGPHAVSFDASSLANGTYLYRLVTDAGTTARTLTVVR